MTKFYLLCICFLLVFCQCQTNSDLDRDNQVPNVIYIMADDLGYGELGVYGQELIETPHIDALANSGMIFTQHYAASPVCAPSRCGLLTGFHMGHAFIRGNHEWASRGDVWNFDSMFLHPSYEGQYPLPDSVLTVGEIFQQNGYRTGIVGKWGLGAPMSEGAPNQQGFDFFYGYNCQRQAHNLYPTHLWKNEDRVLLENKFDTPHTALPEDFDATDGSQFPDLYQKDYAPTSMIHEAIEFIGRNKQNPFFLYYPSPLPHLPLQATKKHVDYYRKKFGPEEPYLGKSYFQQQYPRAAYAAMISILDEQVGAIIQKLKEEDIYDNTLIIFTSDNGPTYTGGADTEFFQSAKPFKTSYGRGKGFVYEGGIRVPMIASWPRKIKPRSTTDHISAFYDWFPTACQLLNIPVPENLDGISYLPTLLGHHQDKHQHLYWEFPSYNGQQAVRMGKWKAIRKDMMEDNTTIELYDLEKDLIEENNLADQYPDIVAKIESIMLNEHTISPIRRFRYGVLGENVTH